MANHWAGVVFSLGLLVVLVATLFPLAFVWPAGLDWTAAGQVVDWRLIRPESVKDYFLNLLLFVPIGFGTAAWLRQRSLSLLQTVVVVLAVGFSLTVLVEFLQLFLLERNTALADVLSNTAGAFLGFLLFRLGGTALLALATRLVNLVLPLLYAGGWAVLLVVYVVGIGVWVGAGPGDSSLSNWDDAFPLVLGNEATGDRPWQGEIGVVAFADQVLPAATLAEIFSAADPAMAAADWRAFYRLEEGDLLVDQAGHLPDLRRQAPSSAEPATWWVSAMPVSALSRQLRATGQFTLVTTVATGALQQDGPARIVSLSSDPFQRNFTLGQEGDDLSIRLRTPVTGRNGVLPEFAVPNFFTDQERHLLVVTYDGATLRVYRDGEEEAYTFRLDSEITSLRSLFGAQDRWILRPAAGLWNAYTLLFQALVVLPPVFLLVLFTTHRRWSLIQGGLLVGGFILVFALLVEVVSAGPGREGVRLEVILLDLALAAAAYLFFVRQVPPWLKRNESLLLSAGADF